MRRLALIAAAAIVGCEPDPQARRGPQAAVAPSASAGVHPQRAGCFSRNDLPDWDADFRRTVDPDIAVEDVTIENRVVDPVLGGSTGSLAIGFLVNRGPEAVAERQVRFVRWTRVDGKWSGQFAVAVTVGVLPIGRRARFEVPIRWQADEVEAFAVAACSPNNDEGRWVNLESSRFNRELPFKVERGRLLLQGSVHNGTAHIVSEFRVAVDLYDGATRRVGGLTADWAFDGVGEPMGSGVTRDFTVFVGEPNVRFVTTRAIGRIR